MKRDDHGQLIIPEFRLEGETLVHDKARNKMVMRLKGVAVLPVGTMIELPESVDSAEVIGVRLTRATGERGAYVCLDVKVPAAYWGEPPPPHVGPKSVGERESPWR